MPTKRSDGRLQGSVYITNPITGERKRVYVYAYSQRGLEKEKQRVKEELERSAAAFDCTTFDAWYKSCLAAKLRNKSISQSTYEGYIANIEKHVLPKLPKGIKLADVLPIHVKMLLNEITKDRTREYAYTVLNVVFHEAVFDGLISVNPCAAVRKPKAKSKEAAFIDTAAYKAIMEAVKTKQLYYVFFLGFETGARRGELCALHWEDFDEKAGTINFSTSLKRTKDKGVHEGTTKSEYSVRTLSVSPATVKALKEWRMKLRRQLFTKGLPWNTSDYIFRSVRDITQKMPPDYITKQMEKLRKELNLPDNLRMHSFRHTHATLLAQADLNPKKIQTRLGHADAAFTMKKYVHRDNMEEGVLDAVSNAEKQYKMDN